MFGTDCLVWDTCVYLALCALVCVCEQNRRLSQRDRWPTVSHVTDWLALHSKVTASNPTLCHHGSHECQALPSTSASLCDSHLYNTPLMAGFVGCHPPKEVETWVAEASFFFSVKLLALHQWLMCFWRKGSNLLQESRHSFSSPVACRWIVLPVILDNNSITAEV